MKKITIFLFVLFFIFESITRFDSVDNINDNNNKALPIIISRQETTESALAPLSENDIIALIKSNLDILAENHLGDILSETGSLNNKYFDEIVALGEDALPFLELIADRSYEYINWYPDVEFEHRLWAVHIIYAIKPEIYDLSFSSPDGKYTIRIIADSFASFFNHGRTFNDIQIIENFENKIVYTIEMNNVNSSGGIFSPEVNWSVDSEFAVIDCDGLRSGSVMALDIQTKSYIYLPGEEEAINHVFPGEDINSVLVVPRYWFSFESWETEKIVKIEFYISVIADDRDFSGWYTYDLAQKKILQIEYSFS